MADTKNKPEAANVEAPLDLVVLAEGEEVVPVVDPEPPDPPAEVWLPELEPVLVAVDPLVAAEGSRLAGSETLAHERSYRGVVPKVASLVLLPRTPKLGTGVVGAAS
jgi:hypothetical protein